MSLMTALIVAACQPFGNQAAEEKMLELQASQSATLMAMQADHAATMQAIQSQNAADQDRRDAEFAAMMTEVAKDNVASAAAASSSSGGAQEGTTDQVAEPTSSGPAPRADLNQGVELPFFDGFDQGIREEWKNLSSIPVVSNGRIASPSDGSLALSIGNSSLDNYILEIKFYRLGSSSNVNVGFGSKTQIYSRVNFSGGYVDRADLLLFDGTEWIKLQDIPGVFYRSGDIQTAIFEVQSNTLRVYFNDELALEYFSQGTDLSGPFVIDISNSNVALEEVSIQPIP